MSSAWPFDHKHHAWKVIVLIGILKAWQVYLVLTIGDSFGRQALLTFFLQILGLIATFLEHIPSAHIVILSVNAQHS